MGKKGDVEYLIRADDSQIEKDLDQANEKVEKSAKKTADKTVSIEKEKTKDVKKEINKVEDAAKDASNKVEDAWKESAEQIEDSFKDSADKAKEETDGLGNLFDNIGTSIKDAFSNAADGAIPLLGQVDALTAGLTGAQVAAVGIGAAFVGIAIAGVEVATDMDAAMNDFIASTGKAADETDRYQAVLENIYANNYGEDFQDISDAMEQVVKSLGDMDDSSLQDVTESAFALRDTFEYDVSESTRAAKALMDNFGISGAEAMGMIAAGAQNGLDYSGELLDSISEYSVQFGKMGLDADDMFKIFQKGAESGAWNLDKIGDAVKEMSIRVIDGSETTKEGFELIGLNADEMAAKFSAGGETAKEAFEETLEALSSLEDPLAQNTAGVDLLGTMWEDLGPEVVEALANIEDGAYDTADAMGQIKDVKYDDLNSMLEGLTRNVELLLIPIGEALIPLLSTLIEACLPVLNGLLGPLADLLGALLEPILSLISLAIQPLIDVLSFLITGAIQPLIEVVEGVLVPIFSGCLEEMFTFASEKFDNIRGLFETLMEFVNNVFSGDWEGAWENIKEIAGAFIEPFSETIDNAKAFLQSLLDFIENVFTGNWSGAWENVKEIFSEAVSNLASIFKAPLNAIVDAWNSLASSIGTVSIPAWVPIVGGNSYSLPRFSRLKVGLDYVPNDMYPAFLDEGEWVLTKEEASTLRSLGGIDGIVSMMDDTSSSSIIVETSGEPIDYKELGNAVYDAFKKHGMGIFVNKREIGRLITDIQQERG